MCRRQSDPMPENTTSGHRDGPGTPWSPFRFPAFTVLWVATVISNIGTWMHDVGAGWLMTELSASPAIVAAVQAATTLPIFLFALLAGAVADIVDRRKLLLIANTFLSVVALLLAGIVYLGLMTPALLLIFTFAMGTGAAFMAPVWQAIVPKLIDPPHLGSAIALNSVGINVSRAIGPALAGVLIVGLGLASPFAVNAVSFLVIIAALFWWSPAPRAVQQVPAEQVLGAMRSGLKYTLNSKPMKATLIRAAAFFLFASAFWAMLPLIAKDVLTGGPGLYGLLLGSVGAGAVSGAFVLPAIKRMFGIGGTVFAGSVGTSLVLVILSLGSSQVLALAAAALAGLSWIAVLSSLHVAAQTALPDWVRARGLAVFLTVFFGSMSAGSVIWGQIATHTSIETALMLAAGGALVFALITLPVKLKTYSVEALAPSSHWPEPVLMAEDQIADGPVRIDVVYKVAVSEQGAFMAAMKDMRASRLRGGGYGWSLLRNAEGEDEFIESWFEPSWTDHMRHHSRVSEEDRQKQLQVAALHSGSQAPLVKHWVSGRR
ncbi:MFS transporter [Croceicoccus sp. F390]|uniref:MFS transporter n=1 Tax=Croceicoccus esteveae TaxID=3075597 RepID=A0ABU2ZFF4_9SPHN|nr:MFS transporter [Croceicoccus sp. F390]MDT0575130.1 MFS transporter [Croceicoccus sp. F390]